MPELRTLHCCDDQTRRTCIGAIFRSALLLIARSALLPAIRASTRRSSAVYRAVLRLPGGDTPFGLEVAQEQQQYVLYLINGTERTRVSNVTGRGRRAHCGVSGLREFAARDDASRPPRRQRHADQGRRQGTGHPVHGEARRARIASTRTQRPTTPTSAARWEATFTERRGRDVAGDRCCSSNSTIASPAAS